MTRRKSKNLYILPRYNTYSRVISSFDDSISISDSDNQKILMELLEIFLKQILAEEKELI